MLRKMGVAAAILLLAVCVYLPLDHHNANSTPVWDEVDGTVSLAVPAAGIVCFAFCRRPHGSPVFCQSTALEVGCSIASATKCYDTNFCNICQYPCN